jgi:hypothetical protein
MGYVLFGIRGLQPTGEGRQCLGVVLGYSNLSEAILKHCKGVVKRYPLPGSLAADFNKVTVRLVSGELPDFSFAALSHKVCSAVNPTICGNLPIKGICFGYTLSYPPCRFKSA